MYVVVRYDDGIFRYLTESDEWTEAFEDARHWRGPTGAIAHAEHHSSLGSDCDVIFDFGEISERVVWSPILPENPGAPTRIGLVTPDLRPSHTTEAKPQGEQHMYSFTTTRPQDAYSVDVYKSDLGSDFDRALTRALRFAARPESMRYNLASVRIEAGKDRMVATDGCRMVVIQLRNTHDLPTVSLDVVSLARAAEERGDGKSRDAKVLRWVRMTPWGLSFDEVPSFVGLASDQKFPDVDNVIPTSEPSIRVEGGALLKACKRLRKLADRQDACVTMRVNVETSELRLEIGATQTKSTQAESVTLPCSVLKALAKRQQVIGIDLKFLADAVQDTSGALSLGWDDDLSPIKISEDGTEDFAVVMPMRL